MKKWDTPYLATMKSGKKNIKEYVSKLIRQYLAEAEKEAEKEEAPADESGEEEENPFTAASDESGDEEEVDKEEGGETKKSEAPAGIPIKFDVSRVKRYNDANFLSDTGIVKSIDKRGIVVTTQPDGVDVLVNFDDITESAKTFFKKKK